MYINNLSGTDGCQVLCHQFSISSLSRQENCIKSSNTFFLKMRKLLVPLLLLYSIGGQGQENRHMLYPLQDGRLDYIVWLRRRNHFAKLQMTMAYRSKRSDAWFVQFVSCKQKKAFLLGTLYIVKNWLDLVGDDRAILE